MARVIVSLLAQSDTARIIADLASKAGYEVAERYAADFDKLHARLAAHPDSGPRRPAIGRDVRIGIVSPYITIYEHDRQGDTVTIFRVIHGRRAITDEILRGA